MIVLTSTLARQRVDRGFERYDRLFLPPSPELRIEKQGHPQCGVKKSHPVVCRKCLWPNPCLSSCGGWRRTFRLPRGRPHIRRRSAGRASGGPGTQTLERLPSKRRKGTFQCYFSWVSRLLAQGLNQAFVQQNLEKLLAIIPPTTVYRTLKGSSWCECAWVCGWKW